MLLACRLTLIVLISGCTSSHLNQSRINENAFPAEFGEPQHVLLVQKLTRGINSKGMNNYLEKSFKKNYSGKFEMATEADIQTNNTYQDKNIYRFAVIFVIDSYTTTSFSNGHSVQNRAYRCDMHLFDRLINKHYPSLGVSSNVPAKAVNRTSVLLNGRLKK